MADEQRDVFFAGRQGGDPDADFIEPEIEVVAEAAFFGLGFEVRVGGGQDLHVDVDVFSTPPAW